LKLITKNKHMKDVKKAKKDFLKKFLKKGMKGEKKAETPSDKYKNLKK